MFSSATKSAAQGGGYNVTKSLRFRASASAYLSKSYSGGAGSTTTFTISCWVKRGQLNATNGTQYLFAAGSGANTSIGYGLGTVLDTLSGNLRGTGGTNYFYETNAVFRDPSAWYHVVFAIDTTQATSTNRMKLYVNGVLQTLLVANYPPQNQALLDTGTRYIASEVSRYYFDGYITEQYFIDGQQLTASSFGSTNATTGVWQPAKYTGTYGTNGYYLPFTNTTSTTTLGYDSSGNSNNWTTNNISLTAGSTYDSMNDVPTLTSATVANYCTLNPLYSSLPNATVTNGNLQINSTTSSDNRIHGTISVTSGKWYYETGITSTGGTPFYYYVGWAKAFNPTSSTYNNLYWTSYEWGSDGARFSTLNGSSSSASGSTFTTGDVLGIAFDADAGTITCYKNGTSLGVYFTGITVDAPFRPDVYTNNASAFLNFGQRPFTYTPPSGYVALNTYNLPTSTIVKGNKYMDATLFTSNGGVQTVTNAGGFKPDLIWSKSRSTTDGNDLNDSVRGASKYLVSFSAAAEATDANFITAFNSNGFSIGTSNYSNGQSVVGWQWQAGAGSSSSNTNGSITSTVSVNPTAGFSVVTYTGTGVVGGTVGHGLGAAPSLIIAKSRTVATDWIVYHSVLGINQYLLLDSTTAAGSLSGSWGSSNPTSSVFGVLANATAGNNYLASPTVAYCWAPVPGFSAFGSYTGNGSTDGPFIYTGFRPKFWMAKRTDVGAPWLIYDSARNTSNVVNNYLIPNASDAEASGSSPNDVNDFLSNGFKLRCSNAGENASGGTFIYMAFAENPFKNALAR